MLGPSISFLRPWTRWIHVCRPLSWTARHCGMRNCAGKVSVNSRSQFVLLPRSRLSPLRVSIHLIPAKSACFFEPEASNIGSMHPLLGSLLTPARTSINGSRLPQVGVECLEDGVLWHNQACNMEQGCVA